jgi:hypothetical protein
VSLFDQVLAAEDVPETTVEVPQWGGIKVLFRGITYAALEEIQQVDMEAAQNGDHLQAVRMIQATAYDPETRELAFPGEEGQKLLLGKSYEAIMLLLTEGALIVIGNDKAETAGKDSSSAETDSPTPVA